jgi:hypothetical protein
MTTTTSTSPHPIQGSAGGRAPVAAHDSSFYSPPRGGLNRNRSSKPCGASREDAPQKGTQ